MSNLGLYLHFFAANVRGIFKGLLRSPLGNTPKIGHVIPHNFSGVCVAMSSSQSVNAYLIEQLVKLKTPCVRIDLTYGDDNHHVAKFIEAIHQQSIEIHLHLVQPLNSAKKIYTTEEQEIWRHFVANMADRYANNVAHIEIGSTINRKRWAGYSLSGFLIAWSIAYQEITSRQIRLAGPSITDFEPVYNLGILALLKSKHQLPDIVSNNLFSERCTEPERDDHKIVGRSFARIAGFRLIKKAHVLMNISHAYGIQHLISPAAFWTLPRIERLLPDSEQKQADYLTRYMVLCAASGDLDYVGWGPLVCHREGLIDDAVKPYPELERITLYRNIGHRLSAMRTRDAFRAMQAFNERILGATYLGPAISKSSRNDGLEIHVFKHTQYLIHIAWTINGKVALIKDLYPEGLTAAIATFNHLGESRLSIPEVITESPLYIHFPANADIETSQNVSLCNNVAIHAHIADKSYFEINTNGWRGLLLAKNKTEAEHLMVALQPQDMVAQKRTQSLRYARNAIWTIQDPRNNEHKLVVKQPVTMHAHKKWLDRNKPSKALRSWNGACELLRRGVANATPVAYLERIDDRSLMQNYYVCEFVDATCSLRDALNAFAKGQESIEGIMPQTLYPALCDFIFNMHSRGVFFRDLSSGNILITKEENYLHFSLIDTARARFYSQGTPLNERLSDLTRACNKMPVGGREWLMREYMRKMGKTFGSRQRFPFHLYDTKVFLKRYTKAKTWKRLINKK